jgi:hypothetical protein
MEKLREYFTTLRERFAALRERLSALRESLSVRVLLILLALGIPLTLLLMFALRGMAYHLIVVPILYSLWLAKFLFDALPQPLFWILFLLLMLRLAWRSLRPPKQTLHHSQLPEVSTPEGRLMVWLQRLALAESGNYSKWGVARHIVQLTAETLAYREQISVTQARQRLRRGEFDAPAEVQAYIKAGLLSQAPHSLTFFGKLMQRLGLREPQDLPSLDLDLDYLIAYLEEQLEVIHDVEDH